MPCAWIWQNRARPKHGLSTTATHGTVGTTPATAEHGRGEKDTYGDYTGDGAHAAHLGVAEDDLERTEDEEVEARRRWGREGSAAVLDGAGSIRGAQLQSAGWKGST